MIDLSSFEKLKNSDRPVTIGFLLVPDFPLLVDGI